MRVIEEMAVGSNAVMILSLVDLNAQDIHAKALQTFRVDEYVARGQVKRQDNK